MKSILNKLRKINMSILKQFSNKQVIILFKINLILRFSLKIRKATKNQDK